MTDYFVVETTFEVEAETAGLNEVIAKYSRSSSKTYNTVLVSQAVSKTVVSFLLTVLLGEWVSVYGSRRPETNYMNICVPG